MKTYWDSSALIDALLEKPASRKRFLSEKLKFTRCHTFAETFSQLTGGRLGFRVDADDAASKLKVVAKQMTVISLTEDETLDALSLAKRRGVRGGAIHDFFHAYAAEINGCEIILTENLSDFVAITKLPVSQP